MATTHLWPVVGRYQENGVPLLMEVGTITFHDKELFPTLPSISITDILPPVGFLTPDWPRKSELIQKTRDFLRASYRHRLGTCATPPPLTLSRPRVEEVGGDVHHRPPTTRWINPYTQVASDNIHVSDVTVAHPRRIADLRGWIEFFEVQEEHNKHLELSETPVQKQAQISWLNNSLKINQVHSKGPSKKSGVFKWVEEELQGGEVSMRDYLGPIWKRVRIPWEEIDDWWDKFTPSQRRYDPYENEWDLPSHPLFDCNPKVTNEGFDDDEEDDTIGDVTHIDLIHMAFLDQVNPPTGDTYTGVGLLSVQIILLSPDNLDQWAYLALGLKGTRPLG